MNPVLGRRFTAHEIAKAAGVTGRAVQGLASRKGWPFEEEPVRGGRCRTYHPKDICPRFRAAILRVHAAENAPDTMPSQEPFCPQRSARIWQQAEEEKRSDRDYETGMPGPPRSVVSMN